MPASSRRARSIPTRSPSGLRALARYALNRTPEAYYRLADLPFVAPWLVAYARASAPERLEATARALLPLIERCLVDHEALMQRAGAQTLLRKTGWIKLYRSQATFDQGVANARRLDRFGMLCDALDVAGVLSREPGLDLSGFTGGVHYRDPASLSDPNALSQAYRALFEREGGRLVAADARSLTETREGWRVSAPSGDILAPQALVALGPYAPDVLKPLGYRLPLAVKRGYHMHYALAESGAGAPTRPVLDADAGYVLTPMARGARLTTGVEFARRDAPPPPRPSRARSFSRASSRRGSGAGLILNPGWARGRACPTCCPSWARRRATRGCG